MNAFLALFLALLVWPTLAPAQGPTTPQAGLVSGHVTDDRRNPLAEFQVELLNDMESVIRRTKTDSSGLYIFRGLAHGIFQIRVQTYGTDYIGQTQRVQLERTRSTEKVDFVLFSKQTSVSNSGRGVIFVQEVPELARKEFERGASLLKKDDQKEAGIARLEKSIQAFPEYFEALEMLGSEYVLRQNYEKAVPLLAKAVEVNRQSYHSHYVLSLAHYNLKQSAPAIDLARRAIVLNPKSANANLLLGMLLRQTGKLSEAEPYLKDANQLAESKSADVHWQLALLYNQLKRYREAADELESFLKIQPDAKDKELIRKLIERLRKQAAGG